MNSSSFLSGKEFIKNSFWEFERRLLPFLIILTPYLFFIYEHETNWKAESVWGVGVILCALAFLCSLVGWWGGKVVEAIITASLITLFFIDFQSDWLRAFSWVRLLGTIASIVVFMSILRENSHKIIGLVFIVFFAVTLGQLAFSNITLQPKGVPIARSINGDLPTRIIHIILDAHIGIEGMLSNTLEASPIKERVKNFYQNYGFQVFGGAYSHFYLTTNSIRYMFNYSEHSDTRILSKSNNNGERFELSENEYFNDLASLGYGINVWQSSHLDYCRSDVKIIDTCSSYLLWDHQGLEDVGIPLFDRIMLLMGSFVKPSYILSHWAKYQYDKRAFPLAAQMGIALPQWSWGKLMHPWTLNSLKALDQVWKEILGLPKGSVLFAHLILPHQPFALNADCSVRSNVKHWGVEVRGGAKDENFRQYYEQLTCVYSKLESLFTEMQQKGIFENSLIIIHGDHGSRVTMNGTTVENSGLVTPDDLLNAYSALFAVKLPNVPGGYDSQILPLEHLLKGVVRDYLMNGKDLEFQSSPSFVYFHYQDFRKVGDEHEQLPFSFPDGGPIDIKAVP